MALGLTVQPGTWQHAPELLAGAAAGACATCRGGAWSAWRGAASPAGLAVMVVGFHATWCGSQCAPAAAAPARGAGAPSPECCTSCSMPGYSGNEAAPNSMAPPAAAPAARLGRAPRGGADGPGANACDAPGLAPDKVTVCTVRRNRDGREPCAHLVTGAHAQAPRSSCPRPIGLLRSRASRTTPKARATGRRRSHRLRRPCTVYTRVGRKEKGAATPKALARAHFYRRTRRRERAHSRR